MRALIATTILIFATTLSAAEPELASTAMLVHASDDSIDPSLGAALASSDPRVRAAAARVAGVRARTDLVETIRTVVQRETDIAAAREELRALVLLGGRDELDVAFEVSRRFETRLDEAIVLSVARLGPAVALEEYWSRLHVIPATHRSSFFRMALWGAPAQATVAASRLLGRGDLKGWESLLTALSQSNHFLEAGPGTAALGHKDSGFGRKVAEHWLHTTLDRGGISTSVKNAVDAVDASTLSPDVSFRLELLRRLVGLPNRATTPEWLSFIGSAEGSYVLKSNTLLLTVLTDEEAAAVAYEKEERRAPRKLRSALKSVVVAESPYYLPSTLPAGIGQAVFASTGCQSALVGIADAAVDRQGRVTLFDSSRISGIRRRGCEEALQTLAKLSLVYNNSIGSALSTSNVAFIRPARGGLCLDELPPPEKGELELEGCLPYRAFDDYSGCKPPKVKSRVDPAFPESARKQLRAQGGRSTMVVVRALITESGCVRDVALVEQSPIPEINGAALLAAAAWKFAPATRLGHPIPVEFHLTINFSLR